MRTDDLNRAAGGAEPDHGGDPGLWLRALPDRAEPPFGFEELQRRARAAGRMGVPRRSRARQPALWLMAAAVAVLMAGLWWYHGPAPAPGPITARPPVAATVVAPAQSSTVSAERYLQQRPRHALVKVDSQVAVMALEDRIAVVDDQLNAARLRAPRAQQVAMLMRDRRQLVESLAQVRYAQDLVEMP